MWTRSQPILSTILVLVFFAEPSSAEEPLSAIDWLSQSVAVPVALPVPPRPAEATDIAKGALPEAVSVQTIDGPSQDAVGLLPVSVSGLPRDLWGPSLTDEVIGRLDANDQDTLPALRQVLYRLLLAEVRPPVDSDQRGRLFLARVDRLLAMGALDQAQALLEQAGPAQPDTFRRWLDVSLLLGNEDRACKTMVDLPAVSPTFPARIFCLVRGGQWDTAALTLQTGRALGLISPEEDALLSRFLDPELFEGKPLLPALAHPTPLGWRMMQAIGQPMATNALPLAFAQADLQPTSGWKSQIEAAERLTRSGALPATRLFGLYTQGKPAASGGVWDRAAAVQAFDLSYRAADQAALAQTLPVVWQKMEEAELEVAFAEIYGEGLAKLELKGTAGAAAFRIGLLSPAFEAVAQAHVAASPEDAFLIGLATGNLAAAAPPDNMGAAIKTGFSEPALAADIGSKIAERRIGEVILQALVSISNGASGDLAQVADGLAILRALGLELDARQAALELMLLERRG